jgi:membrane protein involved in D-alanine export
VTPYADLSYFLLLCYPLAALVVLGTLGRLGRAGVLVVGLVVVLFQYGNAPDPGAGTRQLAFLAAYAAACVAAIRGYAAVRRPAAFAVALAAVLLPLVAVKVYPLLAPGAEHALATKRGVGASAPGGDSLVTAGFLETFGFLGISYMALRAVDVLIALRDRVLAAPPRTSDVASYLLFAPTVSAGPIDRFTRFAADLEALPRPRRDYLADVEAGVHRLAQGFLYKFVVATCSPASATCTRSAAISSSTSPATARSPSASAASSASACPRTSTRRSAARASARCGTAGT